MRVVPYKPEHLDQIKLRDGVYSPGECPKTVMNTAFTFLDGEDVVAICGGFLFVPGVIHFWGLLSDLVTRKPIAFHRECKKVLDWYFENEKPRRIQIDVRADYEMGRRWAVSLGFTFNGVMPGWGTDGATHVIYGRTR